MGKTAMLVTGALIGALSACSSGSDGADAARGGGAAGGGTDSTAGVALTSKITAPDAFDSGKGWEVKADWLPQGQPFPFAVSAKSGTVAYLDKTKQGYVLSVREAASGKLLSTGKPWQAPKLTEEQSADDTSALAVPRISLITGGEREFFAVWAHGEKRKDELHDFQQAISVAFYPADASGKGLAPAGSGDVQAPDGEFDNQVSVFPGAGGLLVRSYFDNFLISPDGKVTDNGDAKVRIGGQSVDGDYDMAFPGRDGLVTNNKHEGTGEGGFGVDGGWDSAKAIPPGAEAVVEFDPVVNSVEQVPNGHIVGAAGDLLIAGWGKGRKESSAVTVSEDISAVHDMATGKVRATAPCKTASTSYAVGIPKVTYREDVPPAVSPNGRYLVKGGNLFDLRTGKGTCADKGEDAKEIILSSVGDDGTAYGTAGEDAPRIPVSVSAATGAAKPLPETATTPTAMAKGAGVFITHTGQDTMRMIVLGLRR
ncbi:hypothetical protein RI138_18735 [Streptomyces sp. C11-1]|uniref:Lipoprotein n=1 Tax=Streptomyces durocortorensis TaxID=2811104 RepID=A0ABY9W0F2_9ACTN|nr:hypothetical protein [Streptomyces durocortorensis]WNF28702.1 hypothetical protein RI138_18735 [Streptomyces durocortorensis]